MADLNKVGALILRGDRILLCRKPYRLVDAHGRVRRERSHLLSLRDLSLSEHLPELLDVGVTSFKIEGRLKDMPYVAVPRSWSWPATPSARGILDYDS